MAMRHCLTLLFGSLLVFHTISVESAIYTRWGRTTCPNGSSILYTGYVASAFYNMVGSGSNFLCLSDRPQWGNVVGGRQTWSGWIYGTEYQLETTYTDGKPFSFANNGGKTLQDENAPCVVCQRPDKIDVAMIPGRLECPNEVMSLEYSGFLMSNHWYTTHTKNEYICVDKAPEAIPGMSADTNGASLFPVQVSCAEGSIPCAPYVDGYEVSCAVCTA